MTNNNGFNKSLFRDEVLGGRPNRLYGAVVMAVPIRWQIVGFLLLIMLITAVSFLCLTSYGRAEIVRGVITLDKGVVALVPTRAGIVSSLYVVNGQRVKAGDLVAEVRSEEDMIGSGTAAERIQDALRHQQASLEMQEDALKRSAAAEQARSLSQIAGLRTEIRDISAQIDEQKSMVDVATSSYSRAKGVAEKGFISKRDLDARKVEMSLRRQQLLQLEQLRSAKTLLITETQQSLIKSSAERQVQIATGLFSRASLYQQVAQTDLSKGYAIRSPISGMATAITARMDQSVNTKVPLATIVPDGANPMVELHIPTSAVGKLQAGQEVRVSIDAFPYQQYGTLTARLLNVSAAATIQEGQDGASTIYLATGEITKPWLSSLNHKGDLKPGMTLSARIITERRSLISWLLQPLVTVYNR